MINLERFFHIFYIFTFRINFRTIDFFRSIDNVFRCYFYDFFYFFLFFSLMNFFILNFSQMCRIDDVALTLMLKLRCVDYSNLSFVILIQLFICFCFVYEFFFNLFVNFFNLFNCYFMRKLLVDVSTR